MKKTAISCRLSVSYNKRPARGFTLTELMVVVTLMGIMAALAVMSVRKSMAEDDVNAWAEVFRTAALQARRRAMETKQPYIIDVREGRVQWCQYDTSMAAPGCPAVTAGYESSPPVYAGNDAQTVYIATTTDVQLPTGAVTTYAPAAKIGIPFTSPPASPANAPGGIVYFGANSTTDSSPNGVKTGGVPLGYSVYVQSRLNPAKVIQRRRVVLYGFSARPRIIDNW